MNGAAHYRFAEELLKAAVDHKELSPAEVDQAVAMADVHATLAFVAAHIDTRGNCCTANDEQWSEAIK
jgi:hypothetical protein